MSEEVIKDSIIKAIEAIVDASNDFFIEEHKDFIKSLIDKSNRAIVAELIEFKPNNYMEAHSVAEYIFNLKSIDFNKRSVFWYFMNRDTIEYFLKNYICKLNKSHVCSCDYQRFLVKNIFIDIDWEEEKKKEYCYWVPPIGSKKDWINFINAKLSSYNKIISFNLIYWHIVLKVKSIIKLRKFIIKSFIFKIRNRLLKFCLGILLKIKKS